MKLKEVSEKAGLKLNIQKIRIMASGPTASWHIDGEIMDTVKPLGLVHWKRASSPVEAGTAGYL